MRYKILVFGIIFLVFILDIMELDKFVQAKILCVSDYVKVFLFDSIEDIENAYDRHFNQAEQIEKLKAKVALHERVAIFIKRGLSHLHLWENVIKCGLIQI